MCLSLIFKKKIISVFSYVSVSACEYTLPREAEEGVTSPGDAVRGGCELPNTGAGNRAGVCTKRDVFI